MKCDKVSLTYDWTAVHVTKRMEEKQESTVQEYNQSSMNRNARAHIR